MLLDSTQQDAACSPADFWVARLSCMDAAIVWPKVAMLLQPAIDASSELWTADEVRDRVTQPGNWELWFVAERDTPVGAWVTAPMCFPRHMILEIVFAGGVEMKAWYDLALEETEKYARALGCSRLRGYGRRGWVRFGYRAIGHVFERSL